MNFAWAHLWIKTFAESADKVMDLYADRHLDRFVFRAWAENFAVSAH